MAPGVGVLALIGMIAALVVPGRVLAAASLELYEAYIACGADCGAVPAPPFGYFPASDPALVDSRDIATRGRSHEGHEDATFFHYRQYRHPDGVNPVETFSTSPFVISSPPEADYVHSAAAATGYAHTPCQDGDARRCRLRLGALASAIPAGAEGGVFSGASSAEAWSRPEVEQRVFVRPGTSGLAPGTPVRLRLRLGTSGVVSAGGRSYPRAADALSELRVEVTVRREAECAPDGEMVEGCADFLAGFDLLASVRAFDLDPVRTPGRYGMALTELRWGATSNLLEDGLFDSVSGELSVELAETDFGDFLSFSTGAGPLAPLDPVGRPAVGPESGPVRYRMPVQFLDFEARVGDALDLTAAASAFAVVGGGQGNCCRTGGARTDFFSSLDTTVEDAEGLGLEIVFDRPAAPADVTPPVTTATLSPEPNAAGWHNRDVVVTLAAADEPGGSGVEGIEVTLAGAEEGSMVVAGDGAAVSISAEGTTTVTYFARDRAGNVEAPKRLMVRLDKTAPVVSGLPPAGCRLWPPNHRLVQVATVAASDGLSGLAPGSPVVAGTSNEPERGLGDGDTAPDIVVDAGAVQVRAERSGAGTGRVYTLTATAADLAGNTATATGTCEVPRDRRRAGNWP